MINSSKKGGGAADTSKSPFIPAWLDESDLSSQEFRIYCHVSRRGRCYESVPSIARACRLHISTVKRALKALTTRRLLSRTQRNGRTTIYQALALLEPSLNEDLGPESTQVVSIPSSNKAPAPGAPNRPGVGAFEPHEGNPLKVTPSKDRKGSQSTSSGSAPKPKLEPAKKYTDEAKEVLAYLNQQAERKFSEVKSHLDHITGCLAQEGVTVQGLKELIDSKVKEWKGNPKMNQYLRPETLFGRSKFQSYYDDRNIKFPASNNANNNRENSFSRNTGTYNDNPRRIAEVRAYEQRLRNQA